MEGDMKLEKTLLELALYALFYRDPVVYANKAYDRLKARLESGELTRSQYEAALDVVYRYLWEAL